MYTLDKTHDAIIEAVAGRRRHGVWLTYGESISDLQRWGYIWRLTSADTQWKLTWKGEEYAKEKGYLRG